MPPHVDFDTGEVRDKARRDLLHLLETVRGKKNLVIERSLAGPIGTIAKVSTLQDYGVDKFFFLENGNTDTSQRNVIFVARGECGRHAQSIADQVRRLQRESQTGHDFHVFWVPRRTLVTDTILEEAGVLGDVSIAELPLFFFPLEHDLLSLELEDAFQELYLTKDPTVSFLLAKALMGIQQRHGLFPRIIGKGDNAKRVAELLGRFRQEILAGEDANEANKAGLIPSNTTESVIIIDREVDLVTPLLTQLTYEGLIDELYGIKNSQTDVDSTIVGVAPVSTNAQPTSASAGGAASGAPTGTRKRKIQLDSSDKLYAELRDANFAIVGSLLNKVARRLQSDYEGRHSTRTTAELSEFVQKLPGYQAEQASLKVHAGLVEEIYKYTRSDEFSSLLEVQQNLAAGADPSAQFDAIEELVARNTPLDQVLRLLCIYSCISGGIKPKEYDQFRRLILEGYGYQHLLTLQNLETLQMFLPRSSPLAGMIPMAGSAGTAGTKTNYTFLRKQLRLIVDEVSEQDPNDIAYVYSGYAPLSVRLVQCILQKQYLLTFTKGNGVTSGSQGWRGFDEAVKHVRGQTFDILQKGEDKAVKARALLSGNGNKKTVFVVFVGGVTFAEIAALRFIARKEEGRRRIVICTTSVISGNRMMAAAVETGSFKREAGLDIAPAPQLVTSLLSWYRNYNVAGHHFRENKTCLTVLGKKAGHSAPLRDTRICTYKPWPSHQHTFHPHPIRTIVHDLYGCNKAKSLNYTADLSLRAGNLGNKPANPDSRPVIKPLGPMYQSDASVAGSDSVIQTRADDLFGQACHPTSAPTSKTLLEENSVQSEGSVVVSLQGAGSVSSASHGGPSTIDTASFSVQTESSGMVEHHCFSDNVGGFEVPPNNTCVQNTVHTSMELDPPTNEAGNIASSQNMRQHDKPSFSRFVTAPADLSSMSEWSQTSYPTPQIGLDGGTTTDLSSFSSHSHVSGPSPALPETNRQNELFFADSTTSPNESSVCSVTAVLTPKTSDIQTTRHVQTPNHSVSPNRKASASKKPTGKVRPRSSIPTDLTPQDYAGQCIAAAECSRLSPYGLHEEEHAMLRHHISHAQVTTYLNIRNGILRLWLRNPSFYVTKNDAMGCAKDKRWFGIAAICLDWLSRRGYVNFGCVELKSSTKDRGPTRSLRSQESLVDPQSHERRKTIVIIGAGMAGLGCARQLENLFRQYRGLFAERCIDIPDVVVLEGRDRIGGRVYSRPFQVQPRRQHSTFRQSRCTAEMGGMIVTGFDRGNPMNALIRGQLGLGYHALVTATTIYDINGRPVNEVRDGLVENLFNECLDRVSEYKFKVPLSKVVEGDHTYIDDGRDNTSEGHPTIASVEKDGVNRLLGSMPTSATFTAEGQPLTLPNLTTNGTKPPSLNSTSDQRLSEAEQAPGDDLVPVSSDRLTGRAHLEPGTHATLNAAHKLKSMGWSLKPGVPDSQDLDLDSASKAPGATLGSVVEEAIVQYSGLVDLNSQDFRLLNWHIANLEYSNAINHNGLSLKGWDIDAGNEWDGKHSMIIGGYQSVPRGLMLCPTPLDVRRQMVVSKIIYREPESASHTSHASKEPMAMPPVVVELEHGEAFAADYVVCTIPLGVLKHGDIVFEPPLPKWKEGPIVRLGYGVLNKIILTYRQPFWDTQRDIFGVLREPTNRFSLDQKQYSQQRGRMFQWFNVSKTTGIPCLIALMAGDAAFDTEKTSNDELIAEATSVLRRIFGAENVPDPIEAVVTRWRSDKFSRGSYSSAGPEMELDDYDAMARPVGKRLHFAGEHTTGTHPATVHGAYLSGLRAASDIFEELVGPINVPMPLIPPKETLTSSIKRKFTLDDDEGKAGDESSGSISAGGGSGGNYRERNTKGLRRLETRESRIQDHIHGQIGERPSQPPKDSESAYALFSKAHYETARRKCEESRRPGKGRSTPNEVRVLTSKMWRSASADERRPFADEAAAQKQAYDAAFAEYKQKASEWDQHAAALRTAYEDEHPKSDKEDAQSPPQAMSPSVSDRMATTSDHSSPNSGRRLRRGVGHQTGHDNDVFTS